MATVTFNSNLTSVDDAGSTVTSASTSDQMTITTTTAAHSIVTQSVAQGAQTSAAAANLGSVSVASEYCIRLRNLGWASTGTPTVTGVPCVEVLLQTAVSTFILLGRIYKTETWGPCRLPAQSSGYPKIALRSTNSLGADSGFSNQSVEVIASDLGTPTA